MTTIYYNSESCGIATTTTMGKMNPQKIKEGRVVKRSKVYTAITGLIQVLRKSLNRMTSWRKLSEIKFQQKYPENITPALKKQCFQGYWCLSTVNKALMGNLKKSLKKYSNAVENLLNTGYLGGSLLNPCLPIIYKGIVSPALGNIKNHNLSNNKHLEERYLNA